MKDQTEEAKTEAQEAGLNQENGRKMGEVGPGRPPVEHQFQPGHPGGPGRPKGSKSLKKMVKDRLMQNDGEIAEKIVDRLVNSIEYCELKKIKLLIDLSE